MINDVRYNCSIVAITLIKILPIKTIMLTFNNIHEKKEKKEKKAGSHSILFYRPMTLIFV